MLRDALQSMLSPEERAHSRFLTAAERDVLTRLAQRKATRLAYAEAQRGRA